MLAWCSPQLSSIQASHPRPRCGRTQNKNCNSETHNFVTHSICPRLYYLNNCDLLLNPRLILLAWPGPRSQQNKNCKRLHFDHQLFVYRFVCVLFLLFQYLSWYMDGDPFSGKWWDACSNSNAFVTLSIWSRDYYLNNDLLELFILRLILLHPRCGQSGAPNKHWKRLHFILLNDSLSGNKVIYTQFDAYHSKPPLIQFQWGLSPPPPPPGPPNK